MSFYIFTANLLQGAQNFYTVVETCSYVFFIYTAFRWPKILNPVFSYEHKCFWNKNLMDYPLKSLFIKKNWWIFFFSPNHLIGESDSDDDTNDIMTEVLTKVFKDLPGSSKAVTTIIDSTSKPSQAQLKAIRSKSIQLSGFETCRKVAADFVKNDSITSVMINDNHEVWKFYFSPPK